jgi:hypothetical protein
MWNFLARLCTLLLDRSCTIYICVYVYIYIFFLYSGNGGEEVHCFKSSLLNLDVSNICGTFLEVLL